MPSLAIKSLADYDASKVQALLTLLQGDVMPAKGEIRIRARGVCPKCKKPFTQVGRLGFMCLEHETIPRKHLLDFWYDVPIPGKKKSSKKMRVRIYSMKEGKLLESYSDALDCRSIVEEDLRNKTFDPKDYAREKKGEFACSTLFAPFLKEKLKTTAPSMANHWKQHVKILSDYFSDTDVRQIRKAHLKNLVDHLAEKYVESGRWKAKTMKNCAEKMRHFLNWAHDQYELQKPIPAFPDIETEDFVHKWVGAEDQIQIFESVPELDRPIMAFLLLQGVRPGEARALKCKDVDLNLGIVTIHATFSKETYRPRRKGKKAKALIAPIHPELLDYITMRKTEALDEAWVFPNARTGDHYRTSAIRRLWKGVKKKLDLKGIRLQDASRHSFASQLVSQGESIYKVRDLLGHTTVKTTEKHYAKTNLDSLRVAISRVSLKKKVVSLETVSGKTVSGVSLEKSGDKKTD